MNIAVIGWGSLIWCPGNLRIKTRWRLDGPELPIEFARISRDGRLTLVVQPRSEVQQTYWALSEHATLNEARRNLREREGAKLGDIHCVSRNRREAKGSPSEVTKTINVWLAAHEEIEAVIWTGLRSNWCDERKRDFTPEDAEDYLGELEAAKDEARARYERAREYVCNAPPQIQTVVRRAMRERGWRDAQLPVVLFES